ncbi:MAG: DUF6266 family protein [Paludibacter sp.]|nr:DUF6266 family protein [Paludibacter sp.]
MSIAESPLLGPMRKSMGNFTVYSLNGMTIVRSKAFSHKDAKTEKQLNMRARMSLLAKTYRTLSSILCLGFPENSVGKSPQNMLVSANFSTAFELVDEKPVISYPKLLVAKGSLPEVKVLEAITNIDGITVQYDADLSPHYVDATDELIACALLKSGELLIARQYRGYDPIGTILLKYPALQADNVACCYVFTRSGDGKKASNSVFVEVKGKL